MSRPNPFATRFTSPGSIEYLFPSGESAAAIVDRLRLNRWRGQIVGPHGSGKSTLLATLRPLLAAAGRHVVEVTLHNGERRLPAEAWQRSESSPEMQWVIDGYEQLGYLARYRLKRHCRLHGGGLLVTTHASVGLPDLYRTEANAESALRVVDRLLPLADSPWNADEVSQRFGSSGGNVRELLFDLYDLYEQRRQAR